MKIQKLINFIYFIKFSSYVTREFKKNESEKPELHNLDTCKFYLQMHLLQD